MRRRDTFALLLAIVTPSIIFNFIDLERMMGYQDAEPIEQHLRRDTNTLASSQGAHIDLSARDSTARRQPGLTLDDRKRQRFHDSIRRALGKKRQRHDDSIKSSFGQRDHAARDKLDREAAVFEGIQEHLPTRTQVANEYVLPPPQSLKIDEAAAPAVLGSRLLFRTAMADGTADRQTTELLIAAYERFCRLVQPSSCMAPAQQVAATRVGGEYRCGGCSADDLDRSVLSIAVQVSKPLVDTPLEYGHDESYRLDLKTPQSLIDATTVWGALLALVTLQQLVLRVPKQSATMVALEPLSIIDQPKWKWRGLLVDSARHFIKVSTLKTVIDGLAYSKMNVLHWHICDSQSFPLELESAPELAQKGSVGGTYSTAQVRELVEYGRVRGVRIVPEIDIPAHITVWGLAYPGITVDCGKQEGALGNTHALNPANPKSVEVMVKVMKEVAALFPDEYFHIGVDEIDFRACWERRAEIKQFLKDKQWSGRDALRYLVQTAADTVRAAKKKAIIWQEGLAAEIEGYHVAQVWQCWGSPNLGDQGMKTAQHRGLHTIQSTCWYLDWDQGWQMFYRRHSFDVWPVAPGGIKPETVLGAEAALWTEWTDDERVVCRTWPRAAAVADRLWADRGRDDLNAVEARLRRFRDRLVQWGINAAELEPGEKGRGKYGAQCPLLPHKQ